MPLADDPMAALSSLRTEEGWLLASSPEGRFASLFGRDALISSLQVLPRDPSVAAATLKRLGRELGALDDPETEEEPGRVLHEARDRGLEHHVAHGWPVRRGRLRYYGSVDGNAWFLIVLGALARSGSDITAYRRDSASRVAGWIAARPQPVAYRRRSSTGGLQHQGWRDVAWESPRLGHGAYGEDGEPLRPPVAMAEVQALCWRGLQEAATVLDSSWRPAADRALAVFTDVFVGADGNLPALARHAGGVDHSATSDLGRILWTGALAHLPRSAAVAWERLHRSDLSTAWGLRTLSSTHRAFRPDGYHTGAVWPVDTWLGAGGLDSVHPGSGESLRRGVREAVRRLGGYPELYAVELDGSLRPCEEACVVQAWTVGALVAIGAGWDGRAWAGDSL